MGGDEEVCNEGGMTWGGLSYSIRIEETKSFPSSEVGAYLMPHTYHIINSC